MKKSRKAKQVLRTLTGGQKKASRVPASTLKKIRDYVPILEEQGILFRVGKNPHGFEGNVWATLATL